MPNPKDLIKVYEKKSPFTGLHTHLLTKLSPKAVQGINKIFTHCKYITYSESGLVLGYKKFSYPKACMHF